MLEQLLIVKLVVDIKSVPEISADYYTPETEILSILDIVKVHTSQSIYLLVDQALS
jgi:hypothetical protein